MRVVFIGSSSFGLKCLESISKLPAIEISGVITNPQKFNISYSHQAVTNVLHADLLGWAIAQSIPSYQMLKNMHEPLLKEWLLSREPDLIVVVGWYHIIPRSLRIVPTIGMHASLLPDYRGGAPLVWAMINGEQQTGITLFEMSDGVDDGPVYGQLATPIQHEDTIATLYARIEDLGLALLNECLPKIAIKQAFATPQNESNARLFPQRCPDDGKIDWNKTALEIYNFIRAQSPPYPGAYTSINGKKLKILSSKIVEYSAGAQYLEGSAYLCEKNNNIYSVTGMGGLLELGILVWDDVEMTAHELFSLLKVNCIFFDKFQ